jgi:hypothetical protein
MFSGDNAAATDSKAASLKGDGSGMLMNTSSISRKLAHGKGWHDRSVTNAVLANNEVKDNAHGMTSVPVKAKYSPEFLISLFRAYGTFLARWGGGGRDEIIKRAAVEDPLRLSETEDRKSEATSKADPCTLALLNVLCFSTSMVRTTWALTQSYHEAVTDLYSVIDSERRYVQPLFDFYSMVVMCSSSLVCTYLLIQRRTDPLYGDPTILRLFR